MGKDAAFLSTLKDEREIVAWRSALKSWTGERLQGSSSLADKWHANCSHFSAQAGPSGSCNPAQASEPLSACHLLDSFEVKAPYEHEASSTARRFPASGSDPMF